MYWHSIWNDFPVCLMMYRPLLEVLEVSWLGMYVYIYLYIYTAGPLNSGQHCRIIVRKWCWKSGGEFIAIGRSLRVKCDRANDPVTFSAFAGPALMIQAHHWQLLPCGWDIKVKWTVVPRFGRLERFLNPPSRLGGSLHRTHKGAQKLCRD